MSNYIPKVIYMCHEKLDDIKIYSKNWQILNPEFQIKLYDDDLCREFFKKEFPNQPHLQIFDFIPDGPIKADFWRVCVLFKYGGYYVDADIQPILPLRKFIEKDDVFICCTGNNTNGWFWKVSVNPHFLAAPKGHFILRKTISKYLKLWQKKNNYSYWRWSIVRVLRTPYKPNRKFRPIFYKKEKHKFIVERTNKEECEYKGEVVFRNRYPSYENHNFKPVENIKTVSIHENTNDIFDSTEYFSWKT